MRSNKLAIIFSGVLGSLYSVSIATAADINCTKATDCADLGYTMAESDCEDSIKVACPTNPSMFFCKEAVEAPMLILYGDGTVDKKVLSGKTPIGIVFDEENKLAVALTDVNSSGSAGSTTMYWSNSYCDVPDLTNCVYDDKDTSVDSCGVDGRANTNAILATNGGCSGTTYAANGANLYAPSGCSEAFCQKGQWFLPSMRDLAKIYENKSVVNASLSLLSSFGAKTFTLPESYYWSSTEYDLMSAWGFRMSDGTRRWSNKPTNGPVRPVIYYGEEKSLDVPCAVGSLLGGDELCYSPDTGMPAGVEPVGVVFDATNKLAVALTDVKKDSSAGSEDMYWSEKHCDVPDLENCTNANTVTTCGIDGDANTEAMLDTAGNGQCSGQMPILDAVKNYAPAGCHNTFCTPAYWFVPSMNELQNLYREKATVNKSLTAASGYGAKTLTESVYWSSTEYDTDFAWGFGMGSGTRTYLSKYYNDIYVRPVLAF